MLQERTFQDNDDKILRTEKKERKRSISNECNERREKGVLNRIQGKEDRDNIEQQSEGHEFVRFPVVTPPIPTI